ncbi:DUF6538 domain-containing protein [Amphritea opalescens]|uniref:DUF6538 domain-containing protein n=1 Tax=Amphritea opalescens TaxID=2490544 RepID=UPI003B96E8E9
MARSSAYLPLSRHSIYYFRIRVPDQVRHLIPQTHIRRSLQTKCRRETIVRSVSLYFSNIICFVSIVSVQLVSCYLIFIWCLK